MTPAKGYHIVTINPNFPAGARLSSLKDESLLSNATRDSQSYQTTITDVELQILLLSSSFDDNLKQVMGSKYSPDLISQNINKFKVSSANSTSPAQSTSSSGPVIGNQIGTTEQNNTGTVTTNETNSVKTNETGTIITNMTIKNQTQAGSPENSGVGTQRNNANATLGNTRTLSLSENFGINGSGK
jgi:hypothetical protein